MAPVLPSQFVPPNPREYLQPLSHMFSRLLEQPNPLLSTLPRGETLRPPLGPRPHFKRGSPLPALFARELKLHGQPQRVI